MEKEKKTYIKGQRKERKEINRQEISKKQIEKKKQYPGKNEKKREQ